MASAVLWKLSQCTIVYTTWRHKRSLSSLRIAIVNPWALFVQVQTKLGSIKNSKNVMLDFRLFHSCIVKCFGSLVHESHVGYICCRLWRNWWRRSRLKFVKYIPGSSVFRKESDKFQWKVFLEYVSIPHTLPFQRTQRTWPTCFPWQRTHQTNPAVQKSHQ